MFSITVLGALGILPAIVLGGPTGDQPVKRAKIAQQFVKPADSPLSASSNYIGQNNGTLTNNNITSGKVFDRFIQIWLENTDFQVAASTPEFQSLSKQGVVLDSYYALTHPSEPNYIASMSGDIWGGADDNFYALPDNITTLVDLLEDGGASGGNISWACYQENMPTDNFLGSNFSSTNYISPGDADYPYYQRKHNPCSMHKSITENSERAKRSRNFNDFAADVNASALPQWLFVTPNMVNDGHDTSAAFFSNWTAYWLTPLLSDKRFNDNRTLVLLTFDENESYGAENRIFSLLLGGAVPTKAKGTTDSTYYTHYSAISTVQANWQLKNLGRNDVNKTLSNVFELVSNVTGYKNVNVPQAQRPLTNLTGIYPGPLNANAYVPFTAPANQSVIGAGGQGVLILPGLNTSFTPSVAPAPVNLTALGQQVPASGDAATAGQSAKNTNSSSGAATSARYSSSSIGSMLVLVTSILVS